MVERMRAPCLRVRPYLTGNVVGQGRAVRAFPLYTEIVRRLTTGSSGLRWRSSPDWGVSSLCRCRARSGAFISKRNPTSSVAGSTERSWRSLWSA